MPVIEQRVDVAAPPGEAFAYLHDPAARPHWDVMVDLARVEGERPERGARLHLRGRRKAPSWVGEYAEFAPPHSSTLRLVDGVGMPFSTFAQTITVAADGSGSIVGLRLEYRTRGPLRIVEPMTIRPRLARATARSLARVREHFG